MKRYNRAYKQVRLCFSKVETLCKLTNTKIPSKRYVIEYLSDLDLVNKIQRQQVHIHDYQLLTN